MVLFMVLFKGYLFLPFFFPYLGIPILAGFILAFCWRKWNNQVANRIFLTTAIAVIISCEFAWFLSRGFAREGVLLVDAVAVILLAGYGLAAAWPHIKQWWKDNT